MNMKMVRGIVMKRTIMMLVLAVLTLTGCASNYCCDCNRPAAKSCYNVENPEDIKYYCEQCLPKCDLGILEHTYLIRYADKFYKHENGRITYLCDICDYSELKPYLK